MTVIPQEELRNNVGEILRRAEQGERFTISVSGRVVAELGPAARHRWVSGRSLRELRRVACPGLGHDLAGFPGDLTDPFTR